MRKRNIKTVAHWVIMCFLLLFPIVLVGISAFANGEEVVERVYQFETNDVTTVDDLVEGNIYKLSLSSNTNQGYLFNCSYIRIDSTFFYSVGDIDDGYIRFSRREQGYIIVKHDNNSGNDDWLNYANQLPTYQYVYFVYLDNFNLSLLSIDDVSSSDFLGDETVDIQNASYKQEVNIWANGFKRLPVNQWYGQLLDVIGVGQTTNSVMNVIYVYPLYVLWVYLIDLILDCLLVIVNLGHNVLKRVDGDIE